MTPVEQFEVLTLNGGKWELVAAFREFDLANEVARTRSANVRLVRRTYENGKQVSEDIILDLGATRGGG